MSVCPLISLRLITTAQRQRRGWPIESEFVEEFWLPALGPSTTTLLRWIARHRDDYTRYHTLPIAELAQRIGLGASTAKHSPIQRTLARLVQFDAARIEPTTTADAIALGVHTHLYPLPARLLAKLPDTLRAAHERAIAAVAVA